MSHGLAAFDRIILFLLGASALVLGAVALAVRFEVPQAQELAGQIDVARAGELTNYSWWNVALGITAVVGIALGCSWLVANLRRRGFNKVRSSASDTTGTVDIALTRVSAAIDRDLERFDDVNRVTHRVAMDRSRPTITWTVNAEPTVDLAALRSAIERTDEDFRAAVEDMDVDTLFKVHLQPVKTD